MNKYGKPLSMPLLARTSDWKEEVRKVTQLQTKRMLQQGNHSVFLECLLCASPMSPYSVVHSVQYDHCSACDFVQAVIRPTADFIKSLYGSNATETYSSQDMAYVNLTESELQRRVNDIALPKVKWIKNVVDFKRGDLWLDIGSGTGDVLEAARSFGFDIVGIETSPSELAVAKSRSIPTIAMFFDGSEVVPQMSKARIVSIFNVLEHTLDPLAFLSRISTSMAPGSYLVIEVPRLESISSMMQLANPSNVYRHIYPPEHLNIFSDKSMNLVLDKLSMTRKGSWYFGSDSIGIFEYVLGIVQPSFKGSLVNFSEEVNALQEQIDKVGCSDVMLIIAEKR